MLLLFFQHSNEEHYLDGEDGRIPAIFSMEWMSQEKRRREAKPDRDETCDGVLSTRDIFSPTNAHRFAAATVWKFGHRGVPPVQRITQEIGRLVALVNRC